MSGVEREGSIGVEGKADGYEAVLIGCKGFPSDDMQSGASVGFLFIKGDAGFVVACLNVEGIGAVGVYVDSQVVEVGRSEIKSDVEFPCHGG